MRPRRGAVAALAVSLAAGLTAGLAGLAAPVAGGTRAAAAAPAASDGAFTVTDAELTWGLNDESNNRAYAPGTYNFLSAGAVPDPGAGGQSIVAPGVWRGTSTRAWRSRAGRVVIEKRLPDGGFGPASFAGLATDVDGEPLTSTSGPFSGHRVTLGGGRGTVDPAAGTARLQWRGSFSVVYYSGYSFFVVSDPSLEVGDGPARLRATLSGYAADRDDTSQWTAVPPREVTLADLPGDLVLPAEGGFTAEPAYRGVRYAAAADAPRQVRTGPSWGSFPTSFVDYLDRVGSAAFWYSSGGAADPHKVPQPIGVSYDAGEPVEPPPGATDPVDPTGQPTPTTPPEPTTSLNPTPPAPTSPATSPPATPSPTARPPTRSAPDVPTQPAGPALPAQPPAATSPPSAAEAEQVEAATGAAPVAVGAVDVVHALDPVAADRAPTSSPVWPWWLGGALLLAAGVVTAHAARTRSRTTPSPRGTP